MAATTTARRQKKLVAEQRAAKERREKILIAVLGLILVIVLAIELPKLFKSSSNSSSTPVVVVPTTVISTAKAPATNAKARRAALSQAPHDVFAKASGSGAASTLGAVATPPGLHDPFASPNTPEASVAPPPPKPVVVSPLPGTIIVGTPGKGRVAVRGWIVILASIPTAQGEGSATTFAAQARRRSVGTVSVLNSSNRRPLRGGYWVVYVGPYNTLNGVSAAANRVHQAGFGSAYIRELLVYKAKS